MVKKFNIGFLVVALALCVSGLVYGESGDRNDLDAIYPVATNPGNIGCATCHPGGSSSAPDLTPYGTDYLAAGRSQAALRTIGAPGGGTDTTPPTVTINQAAGQTDPTSASTITFRVVFSEPVTGFTASDVTIGGTAGGTKSVTLSGTGPTYTAAVSGMTTSGTVTATIAAGVAQDTAATPNLNTASTSTDNTVTFNADTTPPTVTINQATGQADPTSGTTINFTVVFSETVTGFATGDVTIGGTAGATTATVTGSGTTYNVAVSGMTTSGTVIATIAAGGTQDTAATPNLNTASTSTDATVTYTASTPSDTTPPTVTFSTGSFLSALKASISCTATDDVGGSGVAAYMVKQSATPPSKSSPNWKPAPPTIFTFPLTSTTGPQTLYAWAKDKAGNISAPASVSVNLDVTKPTITAFSAQATSPASGTVNISVTATDPAVNGVASGVSAYMVTKSNLTPPSRTSTKWISGVTPPTSVTFPTRVKPGVMLYAWVKDANGKVSKPKRAKVTAPVAAAVAQQTQSIPAPPAPAGLTQGAQSATAPVAQSQQNTQAAVASNSATDMTVWVGKWLKVTEKISNSQETNSTTGYMKIWGWDPSTNEIQVDRYDEDPDQPGQWFSETLTLQYVSGSVLDFICSYQGSYQDATTTGTLSFVAQFFGNIRSGVLTGGQLKTLKGYYVETDNSTAAAQQYSGALTITGNLVSESAVPVPSGTVLH